MILIKYLASILLLNLFLIYVTLGHSSLQCGADWNAYDDEKCFKVFGNKLVQSYDDAKTMCEQTEGSSLVTISSLAEQEFLFILLVNVHSVTNNVWIGARHKGETFVWTDNTPLNYTNWADNNPRVRNGYDCVHMSLIEPHNGQWLNVPCSHNYLVVCQKAQNWSLSYLQQTMKELRHFFRETKNELRFTKFELKQALSDLEATKDDLAITKVFLQNQIKESSTPPGTVAYFTHTTAPLGWLKANGQSVSRTTYDNLFATIGTTFGSGDGSTTFTLPDLCGEFIRGWSDGRDVDINRVFSSFQGGSIIPFGGVINHTWAAGSFPHHNRYGWFAGSTFDDGFDDGILPGQTSKGITYPYHPYTTEMYFALTPNKGYITAWMSLRGTRPRNVALLACIKH